MDCFITYKKSNGETILRPRKSDGGLKIGEKTSMGWTVINIHYEYNGNYYTYKDYRRVFIKNHKETRRNKLIEYTIRQLKKLEKTYL